LGAELGRVQVKKRKPSRKDLERTIWNLHDYLDRLGRLLRGVVAEHGDLEVHNAEINGNHDLVVATKSTDNGIILYLEPKSGNPQR
jgi:hypothetical protein